MSKVNGIYTLKEDWKSKKIVCEQCCEEHQYKPLEKVFTAKYKNKNYYFCSHFCKQAWYKQLREEEELYIW